jgi:conjugative transposon TraM protein
MKTDEKKKAVHITDGSKASVLHEEGETVPLSVIERYKKPMIYVLMAIVFIGCMYMIFQPSDKDVQAEQAGINDAVPQASGPGMEPDKQKAYEKENLEQLQQQKRKGLQTLSDYWNADSTGQGEVKAGTAQEQGTQKQQENTAAALTNYRSMQSTLGGFYEADTEKAQLKKELETLKAQAAQKASAPANPMQHQLALMEKSYQMAAKYFPGSGASARDSTAAAAPVSKALSPLVPKAENTVSLLTQNGSNEAVAQAGSYGKGFRDAAVSTNSPQQKNSLLACVHQEQQLTGEGVVKLRLLEAALIRGISLPEGTLLSAVAKLQNSRVSLKIVSIEAGGAIIPVEIIVYDLDGQQGLAAPVSGQVSALRDIAGNMGQSAGTNMMLTRSAGQQIAADMSRGVVQGVSGYFSKSVKAPKVQLRAGYKVLLVSKK